MVQKEDIIDRNNEDNLYLEENVFYICIFFDICFNFNVVD